MRYIQTKQGYALMDNLVDGTIEILSMSDDIAFAFDSSGVLLKHGPKAAVEEWASHARRAYASADAVAMAVSLWTVTFGKGIPIDEINKCLSTSGYIVTFVKKFGHLALQHSNEKNSEGHL